MVLNLWIILKQNNIHKNQKISYKSKKQDRSNLTDGNENNTGTAGSAGNRTGNNITGNTNDNLEDDTIKDTTHLYYFHYHL